MSFLARAKKPETKPPMLTLVGSPGAGKTTLGAMFPGAIMVVVEDGTSVFDSWADEAKPTVLPRIPKASKDGAGNLRSSKEHLFGIIDELISADHDFKTLVVDSITTLDIMFGHEVALRDNVGTVADASGGFHKGFAEVASWHAELIYKCEQLRAVKKMGIVFLAHTGVKKMRNRPDAAADYSVYSMDMDQQALSVYTSQSDAVLYLVKEEFVVGSETNRKGQTTKYGRVTQTGDRKLITTSDGQVGYVNAKNRYDMPAEIPVEHGTNPVLQYIKFYN